MRRFYRYIHIDNDAGIVLQMAYYGTMHMTDYIFFDCSGYIM